MCKAKKAKNANEKSEGTADGQERINNQNEEEPESPDLWTCLLSFIRGSETAGNSRDAPPTISKDDEDHSAGRRKLNPASEEGTSGVSQNQNEPLQNAETPDREWEGRTFFQMWYLS